MGRKKSSTGGRLVLTLFMLLILCLGGGLLVETSRELMESLEAMSWPTTPGQVTRSFLKAETIEVSTRSSNGIRGSALEDTYTALVDYTFEVNGQAFKGDRISAIRSGTQSDRASVEEKLKQYPVGKSVTVSYNPSDPEQCLLEPGTWGGFARMLGLSLFLIVIACLILFVAWSPKYHHIISGL